MVNRLVHVIWREIKKIGILNKSWDILKRGAHGALESGSSIDEPVSCSEKDIIGTIDSFKHR